jgi:hypothetical protein
MPTYRLGWYDNADRLDVAVLVNRLVACGVGVSRLEASDESGDYLVEASVTLADALRLRGFALSVSSEDARARNGAQPVKPVRAVVLSGKASAYPYYGYYALALARLGIAYRPVSWRRHRGRRARGGEHPRPAGGLFQLEPRRQGGNARRRPCRASVLGRRRRGSGFMRRAYYLANGRPTWLGLADARPNITSGLPAHRRRHHRLPDRRRAAAPRVAANAGDPLLPRPRIRRDRQQLSARSGAFAISSRPGRLFIDNPLTPETFAEYMRDRIAILSANGPARSRDPVLAPTRRWAICSRSTCCSRATFRTIYRSAGRK